MGILSRAFTDCLAEVGSSSNSAILTKPLVSTRKSCNDEVDDATEDDLSLPRFGYKGENFLNLYDKVGRLEGCLQN